MKRLKRFRLPIFLILLAGLIFFRLRSNLEFTRQNALQKDLNKAIPVLVDTVRETTLNDSIEFIGLFEASAESKPSAEVPGKILNVLVNAGEFVRKGQILALQDPALLKLQLQSIEIQIKGLELDVRRYSKLEAADAVQGIQLEKARQGLESARVQQQTLLEQVNRCQIRAPFDGIISARLSEPGSFAAPGLPLLQVLDISRLKFTIQVPETELRNFVEGGFYSISATTIADQNWLGKLVLPGVKASPANNFPLQFEVKNTDKFELKPGMTGKLKMTRKKKCIAIPASSWSNNSGVFVVNQKQARFLPLNKGQEYGSLLEVSGGIHPGDIIVISGNQNLHHLSVVKIINQTPR